MSSSTSEKMLPTPPSNTTKDPQVDHVLVFQGVPAKYLTSKEKVPDSVQSKISAEYQKILDKIHSVGLQTTTREGKYGSGQILIFVRIPDAVLIQCGKEETLSDYLHDVKSSLEPATTSSLSRSSSMGKTAIHSQAETFSSAQRARYTYDLLTLPSPKGAGILLNSDNYPNLKDMSPIHDPEYNRTWLKRWSKFSSVLQIDLAELDSVRSHFGDHIALYFGFLNFYFQSLFSLAIVGLAFWTAGAPFHPVYSILLVIWSCVFVEIWRMKERKIAVRWGTVGVSHVDARRKEFKPRMVRKDPATGEDEEVFEWWRRELRIAMSVPVIVFFVALLGAVLTTMFVVEVFATQLYHGPGKGMVPFIPMALMSICVPQVMAAWQKTASALTSWENHYSFRTHSSSMTLKMFGLQAIVTYGALTLSAFVYLPFGQDIMNAIVNRGHFAESVALAKKQQGVSNLTFAMNPNRMHKQLFAVLTTSQVINAFTEIGVPFIMRKVAEFRETKQVKQAEESQSSSSPNGKFLQRVREELELPNYDTFGDYAEMASQMGFIALWSVIWPLAPVMAFINNFFELRSDALKITINARRPVPIRAESIGPWLEVLGFIARLSSIFNSALIFLFQPSPEAHLPGHSVYETTMRSHQHQSGGNLINGTTTPGKIVDSMIYSSDPAHLPRSPMSFSNLLPSYLPTSGAAGALIGALLLALTCEHLYGFFLAAIRHGLERALWRGSEEETSLRRRDWQQRQEALNHSGQASKDLPQKFIDQDSSSTDAFWTSQTGSDIGLSIIQGNSKKE